MRTTLAVLIIWARPAHFLWAQFDLLTPREASRIVEQIPAVLESAKTLACLPAADVSLPDPQQPVTVDVEIGCDNFRDRYIVDRRTGAVTTWGDNPKDVGGRASEALAEQLVRQARSRVLTLRESRCVALEAAESLPGWAGTVGSTTIESEGPHFSVSRLVRAADQDHSF